MGDWPCVRSWWLDIGQVLFYVCLWTEEGVKAHKQTRKKRNAPTAKARLVLLVVNYIKLHLTA